MTDFKDLTDSLDEQNEAKQEQVDKETQLDAVKESGDQVAGAVTAGTDKVAEGLDHVKGDVTVINPDLAKSQDINQAVEAIHKLNMTTFMQNEGLPKLAQNISDLSDKTGALQERMENEGLKKMSDQLAQVATTLDTLSKTLSKTEISVDAKLQKTIDNLSKRIDAIDFKPTVNVSAPATKVVTTPIDMKPIIGALGDIKQVIIDSEKEETEQDLSPITEGLGAVQNAIQALRFPVSNYVLPFVSATGKAVQVKLNDDGTLPVTTSVSTGSLATSAIQTNGTQKTQITDGSNAVTVTGNKLDVNATLSAETTKVIGTINVASSQTIAATQATAASLNATVVGTGTFATQSTLAAETTKVIGVVRTADGSGNLLTSTGNALDVNLKTGGIASVTAAQGTAAALTAGWPIIAGETADATGTFTNGTQTTSVTASSLSGYQAATVSINGTYGTATAVFEGSDDAGTTWYSLQAGRTDSGTIELGYTSLTNTTRMWTLEITGLDSFRVRSTAVASGTVNVRISISSAPTSDAAVVSVGSALPTGTNAIGNIGASTATGATVPANAFYTAGDAATALPTAASAGNLTGAMYDKFGRQIVVPQTVRDLVTDATVTITASTAETTILTAVASTFLDLTAVTVSNTSATAARIDFRDDTGGTIRFSIYVPAGDIRGMVLQVPRPQTAVNKNWTAQSSASVTDLRVYMQAVQNK